MRRIAVLSLIIAALSMMASFAVAADEARESKGTPQRKVNLYRIPIDPEERANALNKILENPAPGSGTFFMFQTRFTPSHPEQSSLRPGILLNQPSPPPYTVQGYCMVRDPMGFRTRIGGIEVTNNQATQIESIFAGGNRIYRWSLVEKAEKPNEEVSKNNYLDSDGKGIGYFLNSVRYRGIIVGPPMEKLIAETGASRMGVENVRGTRTLVYGIQPLKQDFLNGYQYLQLWVRVGDFKIIRTNLEKIYGTEFTEYSRHVTGVRFDDENFLLPDETIDQMRKEFDAFVKGPEKTSAPAENQAKKEEKPAE